MNLDCIREKTGHKKAPETVTNRGYQNENVDYENVVKL